MIATGQPRFIEAGTPTAHIWIVGEAPGAEEVATGQPFSGSSGHLLNTLLGEVGISRGACFITNVCHVRPPPKFVNGRKIENDISTFFPTKTEGRRLGLPVILGRYVHQPIVDGVARLNSLLSESSYQPDLILAMGGTALWALTGEMGIMKWRGSAMTAVATPAQLSKVLPTVHPAAIMREWPNRYLALQDLRRWNRVSAFVKPDWCFTIRPTLEDVLSRLHIIRLALDRAASSGFPLASDIETRGGQIACIGLAWTTEDALCIPLMCLERPEGYWNASEELLIITTLKTILCHPSARVIFQNGAYDLQYFAKQYGFLPNLRDDTMLMQHTCFPGLRKGLDFLSSLYCSYHRYWKDDGKEWHAGGVGDEDRYWTYNCEDCVRTLEVWHTLTRVIDSMGLRRQYEEQMTFFPIVLEMMLRGNAIDPVRRARMRAELEDFITKTQAWFKEALGHELNVNSTPQMRALFFDDLQVPEIKNRKTGALTLDAEALKKIERKFPVLKPLLQRIADERTARTTLSNVLEAELSEDGRARCTYNLAATETFRLNSSEDAFGTGFNLQNLTKGDEE